MNVNTSEVTRIVREMSVSPDLKSDVNSEHDLYKQPLDRIPVTPHNSELVDAIIKTNELLKPSGLWFFINKEQTNNISLKDTGEQRIVSTLSSAKFMEIAEKIEEYFQDDIVNPSGFLIDAKV